MHNVAESLIDSRSWTMDFIGYQPRPGSQVIAYRRGDALDIVQVFPALRRASACTPCRTLDCSSSMNCFRRSATA